MEGHSDKVRPTTKLGRFINVNAVFTSIHYYLHYCVVQAPSYIVTDVFLITGEKI